MMTDLITPVVPFTRHRVMRSMNERVARFGVEFEMLAWSDTGYDDDWEHHCDYDDDCYCEPPETGTSRRAERLFEALADAGLIRSSGSQCPYHCDCDDCDYSRDPWSSAWLAFQQDGTVGAEFVTRITRIDTERRHLDQMSLMVETLAGYYRTPGAWKPDGYEAAGEHVHVSSSGDDNGKGVRFHRQTRHQMAALIGATYAAFDWNEAGSGGCGSRQIRHYNKKPSDSNTDKIADGYGYGFTGSWGGLKDGTFEHRLWNMPAEPERIFGHVGMSVAMVRWSYATLLQSPIVRWWVTDTPFDQIVEALRDNLTAWQEQVALYIPTDSRFDIARDLLNTVRV